MKSDSLNIHAADTLALSDTLPLAVRDSLLTADSLRRDSLHHDSLFKEKAKSVHTEAPTGIPGIPISYSPRTDDIVALILLACFFLSSIALAHGKRFLTQQVKDFVLHRDRTSIFDSSTAADVRYLLVLVVQTCVLSGIVFFNYFHDTNPQLMEQVSPILLLGIYIGFCVIYFVFKWLLYMFFGWIFIDKNKRNTWLESYSTLIYYAGLFNRSL